MSQLSVSPLFVWISSHRFVFLTVKKKDLWGLYAFIFIFVWKRTTVELEVCTRKLDVRRKTVPRLKRETMWTKHRKEPNTIYLIISPWKVLDINLALLSILNNIKRMVRESEAHGNFTPVNAKYLLSAYFIQGLMLCTKSERCY